MNAKASSVPETGRRPQGPAPRRAGRAGAAGEVGTATAIEQGQAELNQRGVRACAQGQDG